MAEGSTKNIVINKFVYNESQSTSIQVGSDPLSFDRQNEINSFEYLQGVITFYDIQGEAVGNYNIDDTYRHNGVSLFRDIVKWGSTELRDGNTNTVPEWGGDFNVYYVGDFEPETTLTLSPSNLSLSVGQTGVLEATTNSSQNITWSSNNPTIATVISAGNFATVTAVSSGTATITASVETKTASCTVTVSVPSSYKLNIYNYTNRVKIKTIDVPKGEKINAYIYNRGFYKEINDREREGYYISEWRNCNTNDIIQEDQTMGGDLDIYPVSIEIPTEYYSVVYLPNLTQRFPFGAGSNYSLGDKGGEETVKLTINEMPSHNHNLSYVDSNKGSEKNYYAYGNHLDPSVKMGRIDTAVSVDQYMTGVSGVKDQSGNYVGNIVTSTGGGGSHNNMPPYLVVNFIIKYK